MPDPFQLEAGAYEVIRQRLDKHTAELQRRLDLLNTDRKAEFGGIEAALLSTSRLTTENNCVPRDMVALGAGRFLFGYNVTLGLRSSFQVKDVFAAYHYDTSSHAFTADKEGLLDDKAFVEDFAYLYSYYKGASFLKFHRIGAQLYMVFKVGQRESEVKTFKWLINEDTGSLKYEGNRSDHEFKFPPAHEFVWKRATRDMYRFGSHPHVSIEDRVFVETVGGDLTVKVENNTENGRGIYSEPVDNADQTLDDAEIHYAIVGSLILLKVLPYQEKTARHLVFNERTRQAHRVDSISESCVLLPDGHGIVFPHGYVLQTGEVRRFETGLPAMRFEKRIQAANGEDTLFIFSDLVEGAYLLLSYNIITQTVATPQICHGFSLFQEGQLIVFQADQEPKKHHAVQVWRTPFVSSDAQLPQASQTLLGKIGNADIVRCMAECQGLLTLLRKDDGFSGLYVELVRKAQDIADGYFWLDKAEAHGLKETLHEVRSTAEAALAEFEKVQRQRKSAADQVAALSTKVSSTLNTARHTEPSDVPGYVQLLASLRELRGLAITLRDVRYTDAAQLDALDKSLAEAADQVSQRCVSFLLKPEALDPYRTQISGQQARIAQVTKVTEAAEVEETLAKCSGELELLTSTVSGLKIADATETTRIIEGISALFAQLNQARALAKNKRIDLAKTEGAAQFQAQLSLLSQSVLNYLEVATTPEKCDDSLARVLVLLEELEGKFAEFEDYSAELTEKRVEIQNAFEGRRQSLLDARNKRCAALGQSAERILQSVRSRLAAFSKPEEVHSWIAADPMVAKLRDLVTELRGLSDSVRADDLTTQLKTLQQQSLKQIRDKADLYADGGDLVQLGQHKFSFNRQALELTLLPRDGKLALHLTGTRYFETLEDVELNQLQHVWDQAVVSESPQVYRAEYLAWRYLNESSDTEPAGITAFMSQRYHEGYTKGVHDHDAALLYAPLRDMHQSLGLLRHSPESRAIALMAWYVWEDAAAKKTLTARMQAKGVMQQLLGVKPQLDLPALQQTLPGKPSLAAVACLVDELMHLKAGAQLPVTRSSAAVELLKSFQKELKAKRAEAQLEQNLAALADQPWQAYEVALEWLTALHPSSTKGPLMEAAALRVLGDKPPAAVPLEPNVSATLTGFTGSHARIAEGKLELNYHDVVSRLSHHEAAIVPDYERFHQLRQTLLTQSRAKLRLEQFKAGVLSSFVRNRLIDEVYLPIIGNNLAKQIGAAGPQTRTDRMGLLLLISPPGYGKTTLMEYVASRLGITLVKVNGPALGHQVTSLDPAEAPNASAREEVEKLNLAFEMGDNVMIYVDDIQHTNSEFLQKFIPLCDGTRKIEGVFRGQPKTYDLRGRKVAVVMAGNPYTETGGKFQVPDMLANRADTYNLGDILGGHEAAFKDSYIENALTSNAALSRIAANSHSDAMAVLKIAQSGSREGIEFEGQHSPEEINDAVRVMQHLLTLREVVLRVNQGYIRSAATEDAYRTEPPFKLQGSYRNMNKMAEKVQPMMTDAEVREIITDHYRSESQTLSAAAEANLLKWREINQMAEPGDAERWEEIKRTFRRNLLSGGAGDNDPVSRITGQMNAFTAGLEKIEAAVKQPSLSDHTIERLETIIAGLRAVPVNVEIRVQPVEEKDSAVPVTVDSTVEQGG
jgi:hypothetical protein